MGQQITIKVDCKQFLSGPFEMTLEVHDSAYRNGDEYSDKIRDYVKRIIAQGALLELLKN